MEANHSSNVVIHMCSMFFLLRIHCSVSRSKSGRSSDTDTGTALGAAAVSCCKFYTTIHSCRHPWCWDRIFFQQLLGHQLNHQPRTSRKCFYKLDLLWCILDCTLKSRHCPSGHWRSLCKRRQRFLEVFLRELQTRATHCDTLGLCTIQILQHKCKSPEFRQ